MNAFILNRARHLSIIVMAFLSACLVLSGMNADLALAAPSQQTAPYAPTTVPFEGYLADTNGAPILDGTDYILTFRMYDASTGGTMVWGETQSNVHVTRGLYTVQLGEGTLLPGMTALSASTFNGDRWLSVEVNGSGSEMSPRIAISAVPWAFNASQCMGLQGNNVASIMPGNNQVLVWNVANSQWQPQTLDASFIANGILSLAHGGTNSNLSNTGPGFLKQASQGGDISVSAISATDLTDAGVILRDGSIAMTGDLDVGTYNIKNVSSLIVNAINAPPTPANGTGVFFEDLSDNKPYFKNANGTIFGLGASPVNVQTYSTHGTFTWTKPAGVTVIEVIVIGAGGGGGGGSAAASNTNRRGGTGGGGGAYNHKVFVASGLPTTVSVTVGVGGTGGSAFSNGGAGGVSSFGVYLVAGGGGGGLGGTTGTAIGSGGGGGGSIAGGDAGIAGTGTSGGKPSAGVGASGFAGQGAGCAATAGAAGGAAEFGGGAGGAAVSTTNSGAGGDSLYGGGGGGSGGSINSSSVLRAASAGGGVGSYSSGHGGAAGTSGASGTDGTSGMSGVGGLAGAGGGGAGASSVGSTNPQGGNGGVGGAPGGGGGGGGAGTIITGGDPPAPRSNGGAGADGIVLIISW